MPLAGDAEREMPDARRSVAGAPKGKANGNYRHGRFTNEAIARRRGLTALIRLMQKTARLARIDAPVSTLQREGRVATGIYNVLFESDPRFADGEKCRSGRASQT